MAEICPFRALHYNQARISALDKVITQPYDKITPEMQARYYELSPYNLVRLIRGRHSSEDTPQENVYTRAGSDFRRWIEERVLVSEYDPALYPYYQQYTIPGSNVTKTRRGFIGLVRLEDYSARVVHRHEETLSGPKADRLELLKATRAHFGQIFLLYSDPDGAIEAELDSIAGQKAWQTLQDEYATVHSVWRAADPSAIDHVTDAMRSKKLIIADGHHRYETALAYRDYCRAEAMNGERAEYVMATFVRMETDGLTILPTHRVVHSLPKFDWQSFISAARASFEVEELPEPGPSRGTMFQDRLAEAGRERPSIGAYSRQGRTVILRLRDDVHIERLMPDLPVSVAQLDVVILHRLLLDRVLGIDSQAVREERNLHYVREFADALQQVEHGRAQISFLLNPTPIEAVRDNAFVGQVLPQKSTDFYPKLLSGLTIYWLDNQSGI
jgi:uncharacterized protein (DUF1015 family)